MVSTNRVVVVALLCAIVMHNAVFSVSNAQLTPTFYSLTCPLLYTTVSTVISTASLTDPRIGASLMRLHFHDCFVQATIESEQFAFPNNNSLRGLDVVNNIKTAVENLCPCTVSRADILAISAQVASVLGGGPSWTIQLGRRDSLTANQTLANQNLPAPFFTLDQLKASFAAQGLNTTDLVALSGAHTFGRAHCRNFIDRLYNFSNTGNPDPTLDTTYLETLREMCPENGDGLVNFDLTTPNQFDKKFYSNLQIQKGLVQSDQELFSTCGADTIAIVNSFSCDQSLFFDKFSASMIKMGNIGVLTRNNGEIRSQCNFVNENPYGLVGGAASKDSQDVSI